MLAKSTLVGATLVFAFFLMKTDGAAAEDAPVAEPLDYQRICDAFGDGFTYSPGTDTCIKIGGYFRFDTWAGNNVGGQGIDWYFKSRARLEATASTVTELGQLTGFARLQADIYDKAYSGTTPDGTDVTAYAPYTTALLDQAYVQLGGLKAGRFGSTFAYSVGYNLDTSAYALDPTDGIDEIQYTLPLGPVRLIGALQNPNADNTKEMATDVPNVVGALAFSEGPFDAQLSAAYVQYPVSTGYGTQLGLSLQLPQWKSGDAVTLQAGFAHDAGDLLDSSAVPGMNSDGDIVNAMISGQLILPKEITTALTASLIDNTSYDQFAWQVAGSASINPVRNLTFGGELVYQNLDVPGGTAPNVFKGLLRLERDFP